MYKYDPKSLKAEEFINHEEILATIAYAEEHKNDIELINQILEKARPQKTETGYILSGDMTERLSGENAWAIYIDNDTLEVKWHTENLPDTAILCIPKKAAAAVTDQLVGLGVKSFWNFRHYDISLKYPGVKVENVHFGDSLMTLSYRITNE